MKLLLEDGDEHVGRHGVSHLRLHSVLAVAQEMLDAQMLLDPATVRIELHAGSTRVELHWPVGNARELGAWLREVDR